jgi:hypothetical protein
MFLQTSSNWSTSHRQNAIFPQLRKRKFCFCMKGSTLDAQYPQKCQCRAVEFLEEVEIQGLKSGHDFIHNFH